MKLHLFSIYAQPEIRTQNDETIAALAPGRAREGRRLVACWNACNGIATDHLDRHGLPDFAKKISDLRSQRDDLLAALVTASSYMHRSRLNARDDTEEISYAVAVKKIDDLIDKVKGGAA